MFSSYAPFHPLTVAKMILEMDKRLKYQSQYVETIVEESDDGRVDKIALRVYGDLSLLWVVAKFASLHSLETRLKAGTVLRLPSRANIAKAIQREKTNEIPVFEYIHDSKELARLNALDELQSEGNGMSNKTVYEITSAETLSIGTPIVLDGTGQAIKAVNDGVNYKVVGVALESVQSNMNVRYLSMGEISIPNWAALRDDGLAEAPEPNSILWLSLTDAGKITIQSPNVAEKHAVRIGSMRSGSVLHVDIGEPLRI